VPVHNLVQFVLDETSYEEHLKRTQKDFESRWENVQELINFATQIQFEDNSEVDLALGEPGGLEAADEP
jgi:hypothetical protein